MTLNDLINVTEEERPPSSTITKSPPQHSGKQKIKFDRLKKNKKLNGYLQQTDIITITERIIPIQKEMD